MINETEVLWFCEFLKSLHYINVIFIKFLLATSNLWSLDKIACKNYSMVSVLEKKTSFWSEDGLIFSVRALNYYKVQELEVFLVGHLTTFEIWGVWSIPSLLLLLGPLWPRVVVSVRVLSMTLNRSICKLSVLERNTWYHVIIWKNSYTT